MSENPEPYEKIDHRKDFKDQRTLDQVSFRKKLEYLINSHSLENGSDTPDFILAEYLVDCLNLFDKTIKERERWYGRETSETKETKG